MLPPSVSVSTERASGVMGDIEQARQVVAVDLDASEYGA
jgi:hypothetical protein